MVSNVRFSPSWTIVLFVGFFSREHLGNCLTRLIFDGYPRVGLCLRVLEVPRVRYTFERTNIHFGVDMVSGFISEAFVRRFCIDWIELGCINSSQGCSLKIRS